MKSKRFKKILMLDLVLLLILVATVIMVHVLSGRGSGEPAAGQEILYEETSDAAENDEGGEVQTESSVQSYDRIYAYRGSSDDVLYTMAAYDNAVSAGAGSIVLPFVVSQDGSLYVADDDYAESLTGYAGYFSGMSDAQIDNLKTKDGESILKLADVMEKYGKDMHYVIELQYTSERNLEALKKIIEQYDCKEDVTIASRYFGGLRSLDNYISGVDKLFLCSNDEELGEAVGLSYIDSIALSKDLLNSENAEMIKGRDKRLGAWTLNSREDIESAISVGADLYLTDNASIAVQAEQGN